MRLVSTVGIAGLVRENEEAERLHAYMVNSKKWRSRAVLRWKPIGQAAIDEPPGGDPDDCLTAEEYLSRRGL